MSTSPRAEGVVRAARTGEPREVDRLYDICLRTGASGEDASALYTDPRLLGEVYLGAYLALEPDLAFVLDVGGDGAAGYVVGVRDTAAFDARCEREWWPPLRERYPLGTFPPGSPDDALVRQIHAPRSPDRAVVEAYPAHLHVDLLPSAQGAGNGRRLLETMFAALRDAGVPALHLGVARANTRAIGFYEHLGLKTLDAADDGLTLTLHL